MINDPKAAGHLALDAIGMIPLVGIAADLTNAAWYTADGDWGNAGLSAAAAVPGLGYGANFLKLSGCGLRRATKFADVAANFGGSAVGVIEGGYAISSDPTSAGGYLQVAMGAVGLGINAHAASKGFGGCFDGETLVHVPVDEITIHDAVWSDDDWWRIGETPPAFEPSSDSQWLDRLVATPPATMTVPIKSIRLGQRVIGENPDPFDVDPDFTDPVQSETKRIAATVLKEDGTAVDIEILRPASFVKSLGLVTGSQLPLHLAELDIQGKSWGHSSFSGVGLPQLRVMMIWWSFPCAKPNEVSDGPDVSSGSF